MGWWRGPEHADERGKGNAGYELIGRKRPHLALMINRDALNPEIGVINADHSGFGEDVVVSNDLIPEPVGQTPDAEGRVIKTVCQGGQVLAAELDEGVLYRFSQGKAFDALGDPRCADPAAIDSPDLFTIFLEVDIEHSAAEIGDYPVLERYGFFFPDRALDRFPDIICEDPGSSHEAEAEYGIERFQGVVEVLIA